MKMRIFVMLVFFLIVGVDLLEASDYKSGGVIDKV